MNPTSLHSRPEPDEPVSPNPGRTSSPLLGEHAELFACDLSLCVSLGGRLARFVPFANQGLFRHLIEPEVRFERTTSRVISPATLPLELLGHTLRRSESFVRPLQHL